MSGSRPLQLFQRYQGLIGLAILLIVAFAVAPKLFYSGPNFVNIMKQLAVPGTMAVGMTYVILAGGIDLSAGSLLALGNVIIATWMKSSGLLSTSMYVVAISAGVGALIGWIIGITRLQPFVVTLAAMVTVRGAAYLYTDNAIVSVTDNKLAILLEPVAGLPITAWILILVTLASAALLGLTVFGRHVYALGGNPVAARLSGVPTKRVLMGAFALNGLCIGIAAILFTARVSNGQASNGIGYELDAIAAVVIGGASLVGGVGNVFGTFVGALFMACLNTLLQLKGYDPYVGIGMGMKGLIILAAVYLQNIGRRNS